MPRGKRDGPSAGPPLVALHRPHRDDGPAVGPGPVVFLDRDGVLIENRHDHVRSVADIEMIPGAAAAVALLTAAGIPVVVVTNQSVVGHGWVSADEALAINQEVVDRVAASGGHIAATYLCPHVAADGCCCRKPAPGMLRAASAEHGIVLSQAWMVGDALTDVAAARGAGVRPVMVVTGRGQAQADALDPAEPRPPVVDDLAAAVDLVLGELDRSSG